MVILMRFGRTQRKTNQVLIEDAFHRMHWFLLKTLFIGSIGFGSFFSRGAAEVKFNFNNSKLRKTHFYRTIIKFQNPSGSQGLPGHTLPSPRNRRV